MIAKIFMYIKNIFSEELRIMIEFINDKDLNKIKEIIDEINLSMNDVNLNSASISENLLDVKKQINKNINSFGNVVDDFMSTQNNIDNCKLSQKKSTNVITGLKNVIFNMNDISDQIKLVALNASIEAARTSGSGQVFFEISNEIEELSDKMKELVYNIKNSFINVSDINEDINEQIEFINNDVMEKLDKFMNIMFQIESINKNIENSYNQLKDYTESVDRILKNIQILRSM